MKNILRSIALGALLVSTCAAQTQTWPTKPVRVMVPYPGGGGVDVLARVLAERLSKEWGQAVVVETRAGANTILGTEVVAKSAPDGYNILFTTDATFNELGGGQ